MPNRLDGRRGALRVLLADDHTLYRRGLADMLERAGLDVVGEASNGEAAVRLAVELQPDVALMDVVMPGMDGLQATRRLAEVAPSVRVVVLTAGEDDPDVLGAARAGAVGFLLKDTPTDDVVSAVDAAARGESPVSPAVAAALFRHVREHDSAPVAHEPHEPLTERELEVLRLLGRGCENADIAEAMFISTRTVKNHLARIFEKLGVDNRVQAAVYAARRGIV